MTLDIDDYPSPDEILAAREYFGAQIKQRRKQALISLAILTVFIGANAPFADDMPLHAWWRLAARFLMPVTMLAFLWAVFAVGMWWNAYAGDRDFKKTYSIEEN